MIDFSALNKLPAVPVLLQMKYRPYTCAVCGHEQEIQTNHEGECFDFCKGCSWKCMNKEEDPTGENSTILFGRWYRRFRFQTNDA